jgi:hypothetical protein
MTELAIPLVVSPIGVRAFGQHVVDGDVVTTIGETTINGLLRMILITRRTVSPSWRAQCLP